jgi:mannose/fructose/N-acetylgalactosamine-specific phosphotransferase system component IIC
MEFEHIFDIIDMAVEIIIIGAYLASSSRVSSMMLLCHHIGLFLGDVDSCLIAGGKHFRPRTRLAVVKTAGAVSIDSDK